MLEQVEGEPCSKIVDFFIFSKAFPTFFPEKLTVESESIKGLVGSNMEIKDCKGARRGNILIYGSRFKWMSSVSVE